jgi:hypothetical protein
MKATCLDCTPYRSPRGLVNEPQAVLAARAGCALEQSIRRCPLADDQNSVHLERPDHCKNVVKSTTLIHQWARLTMKNFIGRNVIRFRCRKNWTREQLAAKMQLPGCCMTRDIITNIESRRCPATDIEIIYFAEVFGVEADAVHAKSYR